MNRKFNGVFNDLIEVKMETLGIQSLEDFARYADVERSTMFDLMAGRKTQTGGFVKPTVDDLFKLEVALGVSASVLLERLRDNNEATKAIDYADFVGSHPLGIGAMAFVNELRNTQIPPHTITHSLTKDVLGNHISPIPITLEFSDNKLWLEVAGQCLLIEVVNRVGHLRHAADVEFEAQTILVIDLENSVPARQPV
jgi:transcriptional regulator with XRE-family HTH domain